MLDCISEIIKGSDNFDGKCTWCPVTEMGEYQVNTNQHNLCEGGYCEVAFENYKEDIIMSNIKEIRHIVKDGKRYGNIRVSQIYDTERYIVKIFNKDNFTSVEFNVGEREEIKNTRELNEILKYFGYKLILLEKYEKGRPIYFENKNQ